MKSMDSQISPVPRHVAVIMDGNGRWAKSRKWNRVRGHREGIESVRRIVSGCSEAGIQYLTLFAFSSENWGRPKTEVIALMGLLERFLKEEAPELKKSNVCIRAVGELDRLPGPARQMVSYAEDLTADCKGLTLVLALSYGGRYEIVSAAKRLVEEGVDPAEIDEKAFSDRLYAPDIPDPDLLIRTSGEFRISNFLIWQLAYTEIYVTDVLWPDFREEELADALRDYASRERRFGLTGEQLSKETQ